MSNDNFVKVFDVLDSGFKTWTFPAFGLIFVALGIIVFLFPRIVNAIGVPDLFSKSKLRTFSRYFFLGFAVIWTAVSFFATYSEHLRHQALVREDRCRVVEGPVDNFVPMPYEGHAQESFVVSSVTFRYSDFIVTDGFNNTSSNGGPIKSGSYVRICYDASNNAILRLEVRGFEGEVKSNARAGSIFPSPHEVGNINSKRVITDVPWYANLLFPLYLLDWLGIYALFVPYLRMFFRVKSETLQDCPIAKPQNYGKRIKLRNSMIYWDLGTRAIWLRPRGLNFVTVPLMVGRLRLDESATSISETEIRFSSGCLFVMALFIWIAYRLFTAVPFGTGGGLLWHFLRSRV